MLTHDEAPLTSSQAPPFGLHETLTIPSVAELTLGEPSHRLPWLRSLGQTTSMDRYDSRCEDLWEKALQTLSNDDLNRINIHEDDRRIVLEDILSIVAEKQEVCDRKRWKYKRKNGEEVIIRDVLTKITHGINKFKDVGDNLVQYDPHHAALPWAAIRLVLQALVNDHETDAAIVDGVDYVSSMVAKYAFVEQLYIHTSSPTPTTIQLRGALIRSYAAALVYLSKAMKHYCRSTSARLLHGGVRPVETTIGSYLETLEAEELKVNSLARLIDGGRIHAIETVLAIGVADTSDKLAGLIAQTEDIKRSSSTALSEQRRAQMQAERIDILKWLGTTFTDQDYERALSARIDQTCSWILENSQFTDWFADNLYSNVAKAMWIHSAAGFGKTVLCASIIDHVRRKTSVPVIYFFCSSRDAATREPYAILRSWVGQMVSQFQNTFVLAKEEHYGKEVRTATESEVLRLFKAMTSKPACYTFIADGIDEWIGNNPSASSGHNSRTDILSTTIDCIAQSECRLLLVSRGNIEIRQAFEAASKKHPSICLYEHQITARDNQGDITTLAASRMNQRLFNKSENLREDLSKLAAAKSDGMFLWVVLLSSRMTPGKNSKQLSEVIQQTPSGLDEVYSREMDVIQRLDDEDRDRALLILLWILVAERPLTVRELTEALLAHDSVSATTLAEGLPDAWDSFYVDDRIRRPCGSLVELLSTSAEQPIADQTVHFVHFSVREYLSDPTHILKCKANNIQFSDLDGQHCYAAKISLRYLCYPEIVQTSRSTYDSLWHKVQTYGLLEYAATEWYIHANKSGALMRDLVPQENSFFDPAACGWLLWAEIFESSHYYIQHQRRLSRRPAVYKDIHRIQLPAPLYYAAFLGFAGTVAFLHTRFVDLNAEGGLHGSALNAAIVRGNHRIVEYLVENGADVNLKVLRSHYQ